MTNMVTCPVCKGTKSSPYGAYDTCMCCNGAAEITQARMDAIQRVRKRLSKLLKEQGHNVDALS